MSGEWNETGQLTSMLVENASKGWKKLFNILESMKSINFLKDVMNGVRAIVQINKMHPQHDRMIQDVGATLNSLWLTVPHIK